MTQAGIVAPQWVKLTRKGNAFTAQYSADGKTWTDIKNADGTVTSTALTMTGSIYIGLCVTSHDVTKTTTAEFSAAATTGGVTGEWQVAEIGVDPQPANVRIRCTWSCRTVPARAKWSRIPTRRRLPPRLGNSGRFR